MGPLALKFQKTVKPFKFYRNSMLNTPFSPWPSFTQEEADAVSRVILS